MARHWQEAALTDLGLAGDVKRVEIDAKVGGAFFFSDMRDDVETEHWGTYLELDRPNKIVFTWITDKEQEKDPSKVTLQIEPQEQGCLATITHEIQPDWAEYTDRIKGGWTAMLKAVAA